MWQNCGILISLTGTVLRFTRKMSHAKIGIVKIICRNYAACRNDRLSLRYELRFFLREVKTHYNFILFRIGQPVLTGLLFAAGKTGKRLRNYKHQGRVDSTLPSFYEGGLTYVRKHTVKETPPDQYRKRPHRHIDYMKYLYTASLVITLLACNIQPVMAANMWDKASEIMKDVYNQIVLISTIAAIVTASVALLMMNFSKSGKTVDESRAWLKRIIITWAILNGLGFIMAYITPFFAGGKWTG